MSNVIVRLVKRGQRINSAGTLRPDVIVIEESGGKLWTRNEAGGSVNGIEYLEIGGAIAVLF